MVSVQDSNRRASFSFFGDFNAHHTDWLGSVSPTHCQGRAALDFANISGCDQLVSEPTHRSGNALDLVFTDVPSVVSVRVSSNIGTSDHSASSVELQTSFPLPEVT